MGLLVVAWFMGTAAARGAGEDQMTGVQSARDREQILAHIDSIFQAYIAQDRDTIRRTHTEDWVGFQGPSTGIERGLDAYMKNAERSLQHFQGTGYQLLDTEVQLHGDVALVYYVARFDYRDAEGKPGSLPLRSIDVYRREAGRWNQAGSHITPIPGAGAWGEAAGSPSGTGAVAAAEGASRTLTAAEREALLAAREEVWRAWFSNDSVRLSRVLPAELITIDPGVPGWSDRAGALAGAERFAADGGRLLRLEFPRTEIQAYGNVAILYTEYLFETQVGDQHRTVRGRGTEMFHRRNGDWVNTGWHLDAGP
ncbi:MAG: DUF4440 domain-containing protein [Planctomycetes bacterium]|nr:DUF4440 domain-containing protein [Planctomycetota bacterium]